ncbi:MAG TPA: TauD/TfdA family dioxygenase [Pyrinomonadaceae bacterium]|nr:TauD/TfdA family dioxygenase [Pyrinomonadaceae bacterium]
MSNETAQDQLALRSLRNIKPQRVRLGDQPLISKDYLGPGQKLPLVMRPARSDIDPVAWVRNNLAEIEAELVKHGAILFRNFPLSSQTNFEAFARTISPELMEYTERSTPRSEVAAGIYTSTEYPADQHIPLHNENSYSHVWPGKIYFFCVEPASTGGSTPLADSRQVYEAIDKRVRDRFIEKRVMYVRNYRSGVDLAWQTVFRTFDREEVERYCAQVGMQCEWRGDSLRTTQVRQAIAVHPITGETVWFNQAHLFHVSSLEKNLRESMRTLYENDELPRNSYYGDGTPIGASELDEIRRAYVECAIDTAWQRGDLVLVDNMLTAHGRTPYQGPRKILVAMADPCQQ